MQRWVLLLAILVPGCLGAPETPPTEAVSEGDGPPDGDAPQGNAASSSSTGSPAGPGEPEAGSGPRIREYSGNLTFTQDLAVNCPLYIEGPGTSTTRELDLRDATALDFIFNWTPAEPVFHAAIMGLATTGTSIGANPDSVRGPPILEFHLGAERLSSYPDGSALLRILGPSCMEGSPPAQTGFTYTQVVHYRGNVTYAN